MFVHVRRFVDATCGLRWSRPDEWLYGQSMRASSSSCNRRCISFFVLGTSLLYLVADSSPVQEVSVCTMPWIALRAGDCDGPCGAAPSGTGHGAQLPTAGPGPNGAWPKLPGYRGIAGSVPKLPAYRLAGCAYFFFLASSTGDWICVCVNVFCFF